MDLSLWVYKKEQNDCKLIHAEVPYGKFYFRSVKNNQISFEYSFENNPGIWKLASLSLITPPWEQPEQVTSISQGILKSATRISFISNISEILEALEKGQWLKLSLGGSSVSQSQEVILPSIRVHDAISRFMECKQTLPPITYAEARDTYLNYMTGQKNLNAHQRKVLSDLVSYIRWDKGVTQLLIDAHTDNVSSRLINLKISRDRANEVAKYINKLGIETDKMQIRAHGSRYPVMSNNTEQGRAQNRRVVIRIVRKNESVVSALFNTHKPVKEQE